MTIIHRFGKNHHGRDFVIGDVHGCFDLVRKAMTDNDFAESRDRLFSVGDLVDRGPSCEEAIDWIAKPWFHAVRGNHEQMAIGVAAGKHDRDNYERNGGGWFLALTASRQEVFAQAFGTLPYAIEVDTDAGVVGIVHAECCGPSWPDFREALKNPASNKKLRNVTETALWSRVRITAGDRSRIEGLAALVVGHTPMREYAVLGNVFYIDTGAVFGNRLTMLQLSDIARRAA